ncbi:MAG TPA: polyphenol oxidase family protein [Gemmatimonadaceae bacterium]|nr:polyphenol oxidase family protein [Gemmatimonadaceae bacterium]
MAILDESELVPDVADLGITAFTTTRQVGTFGMMGPEPVSEVMGRWAALRRELHGIAPRLATAGQVHGNGVLAHDGRWEGWLRAGDADGHFAPVPGTAMAVTVADCVPVFVAHPSGATLALHSGWRGTAAGILAVGLAMLKGAGHAPSDARIHLGPAICGKCYEVSPDVYGQLTGTSVEKPTPVDLRSLIAGQARAAGATRISISPLCTRCDNHRFYSHRAGDHGRQIGVIVAARR